jgi:hypothetical protein
MFLELKLQRECDFSAEPLAEKSLPSHKVQEVNSLVEPMAKKSLPSVSVRKQIFCPQSEKSLPSHKVQEANSPTFLSKKLFQ